MNGVKPKLRPFAAFGPMLVMILAVHTGRGKYGFVAINLALGGIAAFIAYGRLCVPIALPSIVALGIRKGLAVRGARPASILPRSGAG